MSGSKQEADAAEKDVSEERSRVAETADALKRKATLGNLIDEVLSAGGRDGGFGRRLGRNIRDNPIPATLLSVGLIWLIASGSSAARRRRNEPEEDAKSEPSAGPEAEPPESAGAAEQDQEERAGEPRRPRGSLERFIEEQPLVVGALALALGAAIGGAVPNSRAENRLMGRKAARMREDIRETANRESEVLRSAAKAAGAEAEKIVEEAVEEIDRRTPTSEELLDKAEAGATAVAKRLARAAEEEAARVKLDQGGSKPPPKDEQR